MKIEIQIDEAELKKLVVDRIADRCLDHIWNGPSDHTLSYDKREAAAKQAREAIIAKIDWRNAGAQLSETVVQKFFMTLLDKR